MNRTLTALATSALVLATVGCASTGPDPDRFRDAFPWDTPPTDVLLGIGSTPIIGSDSMARSTAADLARADLAASIQSKVQRLSENWNKVSGDLKNPDTLAEFINNEVLTTNLVNMTLSGAVPIKYEKRGNEMYCAVQMRDISGFLATLDQNLEEAYLRNQVMKFTNQEKASMRDRLKEGLQAEQDNTSSLMGPYRTDNS